jgi:hypothetical protein
MGKLPPWITFQPFDQCSWNSVLIKSIQHTLRKTANINGKKLLSLKPVIKTRRSYKRAGLKKRQNSFKGLAMYGHEVLMSLQTRSKLFGTHFVHFHVSDIRLWRMTVYSKEKRMQHCQATSFMSDLDDVNFPVTVVNCSSPFWCHLNSIEVISQQNDNSIGHCDYPQACRNSL